MTKNQCGPLSGTTRVYAGSTPNVLNYVSITKRVLSVKGSIGGSEGWGLLPVIAPASREREAETEDEYDSDKKRPDVRQ